MKQIVQDLKNGKTILEEVPTPQVQPGTVLIKTTRSLISLGTERGLVEFGKAGLLSKARQQPDKVRMVLDKINSDGLMPTLEAVLTKLGQPLPLGYCNVGEIIAVGTGVSEFKIGDRVASNGNHAEFICVPKNLVAKVPDNVSDEEATFTIIGSIGLQGIRLLNPTFGETIVVVGLGLIGLITAQLLKANGCKVIGFDYDQNKINLANKLGINALNPSQGNDQVKYVESITDGVGADGVIITASNKRNDIISQSARMSRKKGRIILVGVIGLNISRAEFYEKELTFQVSCSYGPGRYDDQYEKMGHDYPLPFVRWTEKRNFEAILNVIGERQINVNALITEKIPLNEYYKIYDDIGSSNSIASILTYQEDSCRKSKVQVSESKFSGKSKSVGIIGAGNFSNSTLIPAIKGLELNIKYIASASGLSAVTLAKKANITYATSDYKQILEDSEVGLVMITTRHNQHAPMIREALDAQKDIFVEKPLCLTIDELRQIKESLKTNKKIITVGFNRRFSVLSEKMRALLGDSPVSIVATMNAGAVPLSSWIHDIQVGGGRIIGEACHYIDLCSFLTNSLVTEVCLNALGKDPSANTDNASILLKFHNGSIAVINYFANGNKSYPKERVEVYSLGRILIMDNWQELKGYGFKNFNRLKIKQDKGHRLQFEMLAKRVIQGGETLIPFNSIENTTRASIAAIDSLKQKRWISIECAE